MKSKLNLKLHCASAGLVTTLIIAGSAAAQTLPKEGRVDTSGCWSGVMNLIAFSKTHTAFSYELMGTSRSNPAGGAFDVTSFRCVGMGTVIEGKSLASLACEEMDRDGDKFFSQYVGEGAKYTGTALAGVGKYEGMVAAFNNENMAPFPTIKPGTFQNCNRRTGTYKLK